MIEERSEEYILDLSKKCLKKVPKQEDAQNCRILILDDNELQKIDNIDSYLRIEKLSLSKNQLLRMYGVCRLQRLRELNLSFNGILTIEGLKELIHLQHLNLEGNNIKTIEHLNTNTKLEYINLSENSIGSISDISYLKSLKELYLHGNRITHLRQCDKYLPTSIEILTLAKNSITDLNEICTLVNLCNLHSIAIGENPCVQMTGGPDGFDHRPFVLNWCMSVKVIDGFMVDPIESLKAEWLFSQGRGRQFRVGEQGALAKYLSSVCPLLGKALENENERKLRLILSKAQHHQRQLQEEISDNLNLSGSNSPSSGRRKQTTSRIQSPRFSRLGARQGSPDSMSNSYHGNISSPLSNQNDIHTNQNHMLQMTTSLIENIKNDSIMTQSLDISLTATNSATSLKTNSSYSQESTPKMNTPNQCNDQNSVIPIGGPLSTASKMVPVPETLMSPDCCPISMTQKVINTQTISSNHKLVKNKENKSSSPKISRNNHLRRSNEKSPILSPRKINTAHQNNPNNKLSTLDSQEIRTRNIQNSVHMTPPDGSGTLSSDDDSDHFNVDKLKTIRNKAAQRNKEQKEIIEIPPLNLNEDIESSVIVIQKIWRGYKSRKETKYIAEILLKKRTIEYIEKLTKDMELTKVQLENERKIQQLQMQAINALWKKVSTMQNVSNTVVKDNVENTASGDTVKDGTTSAHIVSLDNNTTAVVTDLAKTCVMLTNQVQQLQGSMKDILNCMSLFCDLPRESLKTIINNEENKDSAATQTEIIAVHTPQVENQNFLLKIRPSSLPLTSDQSTNVTLNTNSTVTTTKINSLSENTKSKDQEKLIEDNTLNFEKIDISEQSKTEKIDDVFLQSSEENSK